MWSEDIPNNSEWVYIIVTGVPKQYLGMDRGQSPPPTEICPPPKRFGPPKYCRGLGPPNSRATGIVYERIKSAAQPKNFMDMECLEFLSSAPQAKLFRNLVSEIAGKMSFAM